MEFGVVLSQIQLFDINVAPGGNDFALDDIELTTNTFCNVSKTITVTVNPILSPVISCGTSTSTSVTFNWNAVAGATNYSILYIINGGSPVVAGTTTLTTFTVNSLNPNDSVKIRVIPGGGAGPTNCFLVGEATCVAFLPCVVPTVSVTQQPTFVPTGTIALQVR